MNESLKNMLSSVVWSKMMSGSDARNAIIGSALGGTLLGGASLLRDKDPEEDKGVPVRDALLGAVLGGAAGYGIPKALSLYRDSGSLAPNNDMIGKHPALDVLGAAAAGGATGSGLIGAGLLKNYIQAYNGMLNAAADARPAAVLKARNDALAAFGKYNSQKTPEALEALRRKVKVLGAYGLTAKDFSDTQAHMNAYNGIKGILGVSANPFDYRRTMAELKNLRANVPAGSKALTDLDNLVKELKSTRNAVDPGIGNYKEILARIPRLHKPKAGTGFTGKVKSVLNHLSDPTKYQTVRRLGKTIGPRGRMVMRAGKYGLAGAGIAGLARLLMGPNAKDNYAN